MLKYELNPKIALFLMGILQFLIGILFIYYHKNKIAIYTYFFFGVILLLGAIFIKTTHPVHPVKIIQKANLDGGEKFFKCLFLAALAFSLLVLIFDRTNLTSYIP